MTKYKWFLVVLIVAMGLMMSCGDDETGPSSNPTASTLSVSVTNTTASGSWTVCPDDDFAEYNLYRDTSQGVSASSDLVKGPVYDINETTFTDPDLEWGTKYYYALRTTDTEDLHAWSNEESVTPDSGGSGGGEYLTCYEIQGQASTSPYAGQEVEVTGIVTVAGDCFYGDPVAVIADPSGGAWAGLTLFGDSIAYLARGDSVIVSGTVEEFWEMTEVKYITSVEVVSSGNPIPPSTAVTTADISQSADPEAYESVLVTVTDAIVTEVQEYGQWLMDDGTGDCMGDDLGTFTWQAALGDTVFSATGVVWYAYNEWKLEPRDNADLDVSSGGSGGDALTCYEVQGQQSASPYEGQIVSVTGIVVVGGDEYYSSQYAYAVIMDEGGGAWAGLTLFGSDVAGLARGDSITITGEIQEYYSFTELSYPSAVDVHSTGHTLPAAEALSTGSVAEEQWESVLVSVSDVEVSEDDLGYGEWAVDDGTGDIRIDDLGDYTYEPTVGDTFSEIIGVCMYSYDNWKIEPRDDSDLIE